MIRKNFSGCTAIIYDEGNNLLANVKIENHRLSENSIIVPDLEVFKAGMLCHMLIMTAPIPYTYQGRIHKRGRQKVITLFKGETLENRKDTYRYKSDMPAKVITMIFNGKEYILHTPAEGRILNISKGGMRLRTIYNALNPGDCFKSHIEGGGVDMKISAEVVGRSDLQDDKFSEFSCKFIVDAAADEDDENT